MSGKIKIASKAMKDKDIIDMFNQMVGTSNNIDPKIVIPKYINIYSNADQIIRILESFCNSPCGKKFALAYNLGVAEIVNFIKHSQGELKNLELEKNDQILSGKELNEINKNPNKMAEYLENLSFEYKADNLFEKYNKLKDSLVVKECILTARIIKNALMMEKDRNKNETHDLENDKKLSSNFILNIDGDFLKLFNFSTLDFKQMFLSQYMDTNSSQYVLYVLYLIYNKCISIVKSITSPDIDVDKFSEVLINNIEEIKKQIPRCDRAFNKIRESVGLLKSKFGEYYKDFVSSRNPSIIIENFVVDVAKDSKSDPDISRQFREIIFFYKNKMQNRGSKDPKIDKVFNLLNTNLDILDEKTKPENTENTDGKTEQ